MYKLSNIFITLFYTLTLHAEINFNSVDIYSDSFTIWSAIFGLGTIGLISLFLSSEKLRLFQKKIDKDIEESDEIFTQINRELKDRTEKKLDDDSTNNDSSLISMTTDLMDFLHIKSHKVKIINERLQFSNLLNDVSGTLKERIKETKLDQELELEYSINNDIPENIYGDTLNISKVLVNIIFYCLQQKSTKITLNISKDLMLVQKNNLLFTLNTNIAMDVENGHNIFKSNYNETTNRYDTLALYIAKELIKLINGDLIARNDDKGNLEFVFEIPFREYLSDLTLTPSIPIQNILLVDDKQDNIKNIENILLHLEHQVKFISSVNIATQQDLDKYDIVLLNAKLFTDKILAIIPNNTPIIAVSNLFNEDASYKNQERASQKLTQPLTKGNIKQALLKVTLNDLETKNDSSKSYNDLRIYHSRFDTKPPIILNDFSAFQNMKILIVEDNLINQKVIQGILSKSGMHLSLAEHGQEALSLLNSDKKFDIVLMDINMPIMDGYTATKNIRKNKNFSTLPIIALSALTSNAEIDEMFQSGMNAYLAKPLNKEQLFNAFSMFLVKQEERRKEIREEKDKLTHIEGLNIEQGISNSNSSSIFYKEILLEFTELYADSSKLFNKLTDEFRYEQLKLLCLDMRGLSGAIGAQEMNTLIKEIVPLLIYKKYEAIQNYKGKYANEMKKLNYAIKDYLDSLE